MMEYLRELSEAIGVSGREENVRKIILRAIEGYVEDIRVDAVGNITAVKPGDGKDAKKRPRVMLDAHMDEVGFMVTGWGDDGLIRFTPVGSIDDRIVPGLRVRIGDDGVPGVVIWTPIHKNKDQAVVKIANLRIDIGAGTKDEVAGKIKRGDRIAFSAEYLEIGSSIIRGKSLDDRAGCSVLIDVLRGGPYPCDVLAAFTVQEEIGLRGAMVAARILKPDVAIALECTTANDIPDPLADPDSDDPRDYNPTTRLGSGPAITFMDKSMVADPRMLRYLQQLAEVYGIPYTFKTWLGGGTDAGAIHRSNLGVPTSVISIPGRYIHSPLAYIHRDDYANAVRLTQAALENLNRDIVKPL
ncbi:MAG: M42 family metallopeptidase [Chloroflexi bacterium]|nr:M42 family metallopeptidase [Chloroflexota bacterium]